MTTRFQSGGALREGALYVRRPPDDQLPSALGRGEFCAVLAPRQIGKSSLRVRAEKRLRAEGVHCATVDLNRLATTDAEPDRWYRGLVEEVASGLDLDDPEEFWRRHEALDAVHRWSLYLRQGVLAATTGKVVIFIDEIDSVLSLPFSRDDFFATVRAIYNGRADDEAYERLTFCLLGVAAPGDLMRDPARTPFNIGRTIRLDDFTRREVDELLPGFAGVPGDAHLLLDEIFGWTDGHPYMTQRICEAIAQAGPTQTGSEAERVAERVSELFVRRGRAEDANLGYAEKRLLASPRLPEMLRLYRRFLDGQEVTVDREDPLQMALRMTGMAAERPGPGGPVLRVRNRIYQSVFDAAWLKLREADLVIAEPLQRWLAGGRREDDLLRGEALRDGVAWSETQRELDAEERAFLFAGLQVAEREAEERRSVDLELVQKRRAVEQSRWILILSGVGLLLVVATIGGWSEYRRRQDERQAAGDAAAAIIQVAGVSEANLEVARKEAAEKETLARKLGAVAVEARDLATKSRAVASEMNDRAKADKRLRKEAASKEQDARHHELEARVDEQRAAQARQVALEAEERVVRAQRQAEATRRDAETARDDPGGALRLVAEHIQAERALREQAEETAARLQHQLDGLRRQTDDSLALERENRLNAERTAKVAEDSYAQLQKYDEAAFLKKLQGLIQQSQVRQRAEAEAAAHSPSVERRPLRQEK